MKACAAAMKGGGQLTLTFQTPLDEGTYHCVSCDKFIAADQFDGASSGLDAGPGKQTCYSCEEYADMFG